MNWLCFRKRGLRISLTLLVESILMALPLTPAAADSLPPSPYGLLVHAARLVRASGGYRMKSGTTSVVSASVRQGASSRAVSASIVQLTVGPPLRERVILRHHVLFESVGKREVLRYRNGWLCVPPTGDKTSASRSQMTGNVWRHSLISIPPVSSVGFIVSESGIPTHASFAYLPERRMLGRAVIGVRAVIPPSKLGSLGRIVDSVSTYWLDVTSLRFVLTTSRLSLKGSLPHHVSFNETMYSWSRYSDYGRHFHIHLPQTCSQKLGS